MEYCPMPECGGFGIETTIVDHYKCVLCSETFANPKQQKNKECKHCGTNDFITDDIQGDIICSMCGMISTTIISDGPDWNNYTVGVNNSRVGKPSSNPFTTLGSTIPDDNRYRSLRMSMFIANNTNSKEKAYSSVQKIIDSTDIPYPVKERAKSYWAAILKSSEYETHRNSVRRGILFSCIFYAAKELGCPMLVEDIGAATGLDPSDMNKGDTIFGQMISCTEYKNVVVNDQIDISGSFSGIMDYFDFDMKTKFMYSKICKCIYEDYIEYFENRKDATIVSGIMAYVFENYKIKNYKKIKLIEIKNATNVSIPTINNMIKQLKQQTDIDPEDYIHLVKT